MKPGWNIPEQTGRQRQALAADRGSRAWVSANAGSGKTHVLVNRVLRLLLDGVRPGRMLCITYTKARRGQYGEPHLQGAGPLGDAGRGGPRHGR